IAGRLNALLGRSLSKSDEGVWGKVVVGEGFEPLFTRSPQSPGATHRVNPGHSSRLPLDLSLGPNQREKLPIRKYVSRTIRISPSAPLYIIARYRRPTAVSPTL